MFIMDVQTCCIKKVKPLCLNHLGKDFLHLFFVLEGEGNLFCDHSVHSFEQNDCFFFTSFDQLETVPVEGSQVSLLQIVFKAGNGALKQQLFQLEGKLAINRQAARRNVLEIMNDFTCRTEYYRDSANLNMLKLMYYGITSHTKLSEDGFVAEAGDCADPVLRTLTGYIDLNLAEDLSMEQLGKLVNRSSKQINKLFKLYYNCTVLQWVHLRRLLRSKELLSFSNYSITEIAELTGFKSIHYFSRFFKEKERITPIEYRENVGYSLSSEDVL